VLNRSVLDPVPPTHGPVDALLVLSFGGPEGLDEVRPFLENVVRGRGVPPERLDAVEEHYRHFGGVSPLNARNRELIAAVRKRTELPVYFGNRNWHPLVEDTVAEMARDGVRRAVVFATSAYGGYSACRQYHEDIARARKAVEDLGSGCGAAASHGVRGGRVVPGSITAPELVKLRHFFDHPAFVAANADAVRAACDTLPAAVRDRARVVFTAHSVPTAADAAAGTPSEGGHRYSRQVADAARLVAADLGLAEHDVVWQSRSGPPQVPWLGPDIVEHLDTLAAQGVPAVVIAPVGFVSDHVEVIWDLDTEARERAEELGIAFARAATAGPDPRFADMVVELVAEHTAAAAPRGLSTDVPSAGCTVNGLPCAVDCCAPTRRPAGR
jgi:protoporphyrin/coproporphyrin ferrochelatase